MATQKNAKLIELTVFIAFTSLTVFVCPVYSCWNCNKFINKTPATSMGNVTVISNYRNANGCTTVTLTCKGTYTSTVSHIGVNYIGDSQSTTVDDSSDGKTPQITVVCNRVDYWTYNGKEISDQFECEQSPASTTQEPTTTDSTTPVPTTSKATTSAAPKFSSTSPSPSPINYGDCCPDNGVWSTWKLVIPCTDSCGSCAKTVHERTCLSEASGCSCKGKTTKETTCNTHPCKYPRTACCNNLKAMSIKGSIICGPEDAAKDEEAPMTTTCVPYGGVWSDWGSWSNCTGGGCGACGTTNRTRTCGCKNLNCKCQGSSTDSKACKVVGVWSAWSTPTQCTDTCGAYGNMTMTRTCTTPDCPCSGNSTKVSNCAFKPCQYPRKPCNCACEEAKQNGTAYYHLMSQNGVNVCAPYPMATTDDLPAEPEPCDANDACTTPSSQPSPTTAAPTSETSQLLTTSSSVKPSTAAPTTPKASTPAASTKKACPVGGTWSDWSAPTSCTDTCGSCGTTTKKRSCTSEEDGCPCSGSPTSEESCNPVPCNYPRNSCCSPSKAVPVKGKISCVDSSATTPSPAATSASTPASSKASSSSANSPPILNDPTIPPASSTPKPSSSQPSTPAASTKKACPVGGTWSDWSAPTSCTDTCGSCGTTTKKRSCTSEEDGCPCEGSSTSKINCNEIPCNYPRDSCCKPFKAKAGADKKVSCVK